MRKLLFLAAMAAIVMIGRQPSTAADSTHYGHDSTKMAEEAQMPMGPPEQMMKIAYFVGTWDVRGKMLDMESGEWREFDAVARQSFTAGGAAIQMDYEGNMMGMNLKGHFLQAFNRETEKWQTVWVDNFGGAMSYMEGEEKDGQMVFLGVDKWAGKEMTNRITVYNQTETSFDWKMEHSMDGGETFVEAMTSTYTKR